ncbi:hypothetical protein [Streptomyces chilikensis]|uniref:Uncharacterized protein n=1 Tax=Streptomyces chilikensis TaxID=1194079 RepID=A0ABV3ERN6_9ACTN
MHPDCRYPAEWHAAEEEAEQAWLEDWIRTHRHTLTTTPAA